MRSKSSRRNTKELTDIQLILPVLLPEAERKHLFNLADKKTQNYKGTHQLRTELRRLRSVKLIKMRGDKEVGKIANDLTVDLSDFVELTDLGQRWVGRIKEIESDTIKPSQY